MKFFLRHATWVLIAASITATVYVLDEQRLHARQSESALRWARQIASQVQGLSLGARERGEKDPIGWAAGTLSQASEPRSFQVERFQGAPAQASETYNFDWEAGALDYSKIFTPEDGSGIKVRLAMDYAGFLGARAKLTSDLAAAALFTLCYLVLALGAGRLFAKEETGHVELPAITPSAPPARTPSQSALKSVIRAWIAEAKGLLAKIGEHIRELVKGMQELADAARKSRATLTGLRGRVHAQINELHRTRETFRKAELAAARAEALAAALLKERPSSAATTELQRLVREMRTFNLKNHSAMRKVEIQLEPCATDADLAFQAADAVCRATDGVGAQMRKTMETLLSQAKLMKDAKARLEKEEKPRAEVVSDEPVVNLRARSS